MNLLIINGPNLNMLGVREPSVYGNQPFEVSLKKLRQLYPEHVIEYYHSNIEGEIIDTLQKAGLLYDAVILNAGGYTHTSVAIADAIRAIRIPVVEVHISNLSTRESFRHTSLISPAVTGLIMGFGMDGYRLAIESLLKKLS